MPEVVSTTSTSWRDAGLVISAGVSTSWRDAALVTSLGAEYVLPALPPETPVPPDKLAATYVIPAANSYRAVHSVVVTNVDTGIIIPHDAGSIGTDANSFCHVLNLSGGKELFAAINNSVDPPVFEVNINGTVYRFVMEEVSRTLTFPDETVNATGRSVTVLAGTPYQLEQNWTNVGPADASQLIDQANMYTGLELDWQVQDWYVPDKVWSYTSDPLRVAVRVADTIKAMVVSDPKEFKISIIPRYDKLANEWPTSAPDVEIAASAIINNSFNRTDQPEYNAVYIMGQQQGRTAIVKLEGTAGDRFAPSISDLLMTDYPAHRQCGEAILGASGAQASQTITIPVLMGGTYPGILKLGMRARILDTDKTWYGMVRSVNVSWNDVDVVQTVGLERHMKMIPGTVILEE